MSIIFRHHILNATRVKGISQQRETLFPSMLLIVVFSQVAYSVNVPLQWLLLRHKPSIKLLNIQVTQLA